MAEWNTAGRGVTVAVLKHRETFIAYSDVCMRCLRYHRFFMW